MWVSQLSEEVLQKDNCPSFSEPCKITLLERVDVCIYTLFFLSHFNCSLWHSSVVFFPLCPETSNSAGTGM